MNHTVTQIIVSGWLVAGLLGASGCAPKRIAPMTVSDLMEDRVTLDGVLMKCNQDPSKARNESDCLNARIAIERLAKNVDPSETAKRDAEFERRRERLRQAQERARADQESKAKVDPYNLPVVPVDPAPADASTANQSKP